MSNEIKCYELDFGDTNLIDKDIDQILAWIKADMEGLSQLDELNYTVTIKYMTEEDYKNLPEWS